MSMSIGMSTPAARFRPPWRKRTPGDPRLLRRFALYAGVALVLAAIAAFAFVRDYATERAESNSMSHSEYIARSVLPPQLRASDFSGPVSGQRLHELDRIAHRQLLSPGVLR